MSNGNEPRKQPNHKGFAKSDRGATRQRPHSLITWDEIDLQLLGAVIFSVTSAGAAIMLGRTSDGGALSITVLDGTERVREWPHTIEETTDTLKWLVSMYESD